MHLSRKRYGVIYRTMGLVLLYVTCIPMLASAQAPLQYGKNTAPMPLQSLFYSDSEIAKIKEAMLAFRRGGGQADLGFLGEEDYFNKANEIKQQTAGSTSYTYPQFFLESLVFHSDIDWSIWVNGQKISYDSQIPEDKLKVVSIDKDKVELEWITDDMPRILATMEKWPNDEIKLDRLNGTVLFTLRPNQTFSSYVLRVLEGKVIPVIINSQASLEAPVESPSMEPVPDSPQPEIPAMTEDRPSGLSNGATTTLEGKAENIIELFEQKP